MRIAVLSDINGFLTPLDTALSDIASQNVDQIICLGDIVGGGPDTCDCIDRIRSLDRAVCIAGDWEKYVLEQLPSGELDARSQAAVEVLRSKLHFPPAREARPNRWDFLRSLPSTYSTTAALFVHGSPRHTQEYIFPEDAYNARKLHELFSCFDRICVHGHSRIPSVIYEDGEHEEVTNAPHHHKLRPNLKVLIGAGSIAIGAAHGDRRGYVILDEDSIEFR